MPFVLFFFFNDTATTEIYTLSLHDALPISRMAAGQEPGAVGRVLARCHPGPDRKSTRLNSSHGYISYAVFCLKKKNNHAASSAVGFHSLLCLKLPHSGCDSRPEAAFLHASH